MVRTKYKKGNFAIIPNLDRLDEVSPTAQALYIWLCKYADEDGVCFPSRMTLASKLGFKQVRVVDKYLRELEAGVLISITRRRDDFSRNMTNIYRVIEISEKDDSWSGTSEEA